MRLLQIGIAFALATAGFADTVTLKSGRVLNGTYLGGTARQVRVEVGDRVETLDVSEVSRIEFGGLEAAVPERPQLRRGDQHGGPYDRWRGFGNCARRADLQWQPRRGRDAQRRDGAATRLGRHPQV